MVKQAYIKALQEALAKKGIKIEEKDYNKGGQFYEPPVSVFTEIKPILKKYGIKDEDANVSRFSKAFIKADGKTQSEVVKALFKGQ